MHTAQLSRLVPLLLLLSATGRSAPTPDNSLRVAADTPVVSILPRRANRKFIRLPALEFTFEIRAHCPGNGTPTSLLLSVADTRKTLNAAAMSSGSPVKITLRIPALQIGPVAVEDFCHVADEVVAGNAGNKEQLTIFSALSAHASLRCASETEQNVVYVSQPLDVELVCEQPAQALTDELSIDLD